MWQIEVPFADFYVNGALGRTFLGLHAFERLDKVSISYPKGSSLIERVITPFNANAFEFLLHEFNLKNEFPFLVQNLREGFPIQYSGAPRLDHHIRPRFPHACTPEHDAVILQHFEDEVGAGRMSGPWTEAEMEKIMKGWYYAASPVFIVESTDEEGKLKQRIVRNVSAEGAQGLSANDFAEADTVYAECHSAFECERVVR